MRQLSLAGAVPTETVDMYNTEAIKHAVMDGMGISILSLLSVQAEQHSHSLVAKRSVACLCTEMCTAFIKNVRCALPK